MPKKKSKKKYCKSKKFTKKNCKCRLSQKIKKTTHEGKFKSRSQSIAVAFSMTSKEYPKCKHFFKK